VKTQLNEALKIAIRLISQRDRTEEEIKKCLEKKGISEKDITETIQYLKQKGFIDDRKFVHKAEKIAEDRFLGKIGLQNYLMRKGIHKELIDTLPDIDETNIALRLIERKKYLIKDASVEKKKAKIAGFLLRRGFSWDTVNKCLKSFEKGGS